MPQNLILSCKTWLFYENEWFFNITKKIDITFILALLSDSFVHSIYDNIVYHLKIIKIDDVIHVP